MQGKALNHGPRMMGEAERRREQTILLHHICRALEIVPRNMYPTYKVNLVYVKRVT